MVELPCNIVYMVFMQPGNSHTFLSTDFMWPMAYTSSHPLLTLNMLICQFSWFALAVVLHPFHLFSSAVIVKVSPSCKVIGAIFSLFPRTDFCGFRKHCRYFIILCIQEKLVRVSIRSWSTSQLQAMINFLDLLVLSLYNEIPLAWKNL